MWPGGVLDRADVLHPDDGLHQWRPAADRSFDAVLSAFGAMFTPDQQRVADELLVRVCRPGGRIGMEWGTEQRLNELFADRISSLRVQTRQYIFRFRSPVHMLDYHRTWYGPTRVAFGSLDKDGQARLAAHLFAVYQAHNRAKDGTYVAASDYAEVVATVK